MSIDYRSELLHFFKNGKIIGKDFYVGNVEGERGQSLHVNLHNGLWIDFANGSKGNFFQLMAIVQNKTIGEILSLYGIERMNNRYLATRGISDATVSKYKITYGKNTVSFPSYINGKLNSIKHLVLPVCGAKKMFLDPKPQQKGVFFGWQAYVNQKKVIVTEGEIDALTWDTILTLHGIAEYLVLSLPNGINYVNYDAMKSLDIFDNIYLSLDYDRDVKLLETTEATYSNFVYMLGAKVHRIPQLHFCKDVNEAWQLDNVTQYYIDSLKTTKTTVMLSIKDIYFDNFWSTYLPILMTSNVDTFYSYVEKTKPAFYWGRKIFDVDNHVCLDDPIRVFEYFKFIRIKNSVSDVFCVDFRGIVLHNILYRQILEYVKSIQGKLFILVGDVNQYFYNLEV